MINSSGGGGETENKMVALGVRTKHIIYFLNKYLLFMIMISDFPIVIDFGWRHKEQSITFTKATGAKLLFFCQYGGKQQGPLRQMTQQSVC